MGMSEQTTSPVSWQPEIGFHTRFRETRIQFGALRGENMTQDRFAELLNTDDVKVTGGMIRQWEAANGRPGQEVAVARRVATVTGIDPGWLISGVEGSLSPGPGPNGGGKVIPLATRKKVRTVPKAQFIYTVSAAA